MEKTDCFSLWRKAILNLVACLSVASCSLFLKTSDTDLKNESYSLSLKRAGWEMVGKDTADYAWGRNETGSNLMVNSYCKKYQTTTLQSLTEHLFHGVQDLKIEEQKSVPTHQREGLQTEARGQMDGVSFHLLTRVFNRDNCTYDVTLIRQGAFDQDDRTTFMQVIDSFSFSSGQGDTE